MTPPPNNPPQANAGANQTVDAGATVTLDGSVSSDPEGDALSFSWSQTLGPPVALSSTSAAVVTFVAPSTGTTLTFELTVSDGESESTASVSVSVRLVDASAQVIEVRQRSILEDPSVSGNLAAGWELPRPAQQPPQPPGISPTKGAFALLSQVQFAPLVEEQLAAGATRVVEVQLTGAAVLMAVARWEGTSDPLAAVVALDGASIATGSAHRFATNRGGSIVTTRTAAGGRASFSVTNTSPVAVTVRITFGALAL
jgi:hypothetical protein